MLKLTAAKKNSRHVRICLGTVLPSPAGRTFRSSNNPLPENCPKLPAHWQNSFKRNWSKKELPPFYGAKPPSVPRQHFAFTAEKVPWDFCLQERQWKLPLLTATKPVSPSLDLSIPTGKEKASSTSKDTFKDAANPSLPGNLLQWLIPAHVYLSTSPSKQLLPTLSRTQQHPAPSPQRWDSSFDLSPDP